MSKLLQPVLIAVAMTLLGLGYQYQLNRANAKLATTEANAALLTEAIEVQGQSITRLSREKLQAEKLLKAQRLELQQLATDTKEKHHAVQHHLAKAVPGRPNCNAEPLPAAVIRLLGPLAHHSEAAGTDIAATGVNAPLP